VWLHGAVLAVACATRTLDDVRRVGGFGNGHFIALGVRAETVVRGVVLENENETSGGKRKKRKKKRKSREVPKKPT
jgi:hypothetical protein